ncbi:MAG: uroporphyrinogen-III synthase [Coriobacteriia bacterium]|nr:uroporphyrinogen-III synthase [Coriobacteriia bacterium]
MTDSGPEITPSAADAAAAPRSLAGVSVLVTRTRAQAHSLVEPLEALGAEVLAMPVLETVDPEDWTPVDAAIDSIGTYDWIVFTSTNGVDRFLHRFRERHGNYDDLASTCMAAVGSATAHRMRSEGHPPTIVPEDFRAEGLVDAFAELDSDTCRRVLIARAEEAREVFPDALRAMGCDVEVVVVYRTAPATPDADVVARLAAGTVDVLTFTSGAIAEAFLGVVTDAGLDPRAVMSGATVASIGPVTTAALARLGYEADVEAAESTMASLVDAVAAARGTDAAEA